MKIINFSKQTKMYDPITSSVKVMIDDETTLIITAPEFLEMARKTLTDFEGRLSIGKEAVASVQGKIKNSYPRKEKHVPPVVMKLKKAGRPKGSKNKKDLNHGF